MADSDYEEEADEASVGRIDHSDHKKCEFIRLEKRIYLCLKASHLFCAEKKMSLRAFCEEEGMQPSQLRRWEKQLVLMKTATETSSITRTTLNTGRPSVLQLEHDKIVPWINAVRDTGMAVTIRMMTARVKRLVPSISRKRKSTLQQIVRQFLKANGIVIRCKTHPAQVHPSIASEAALKFLGTTRPFFQQPNRQQVS
jgi:hypothetical protein